MTSSRRHLALALVLGLAIGALAGAGAVLAGSPVAKAPLPTPTSSTALAAPAIGAPAAGPAVGVATGGTGTAGTAAAGSAIAYPYPGYPGAPGLAPDHTIVVTGVGRADLAADGSGRAAAVKAATTAALADAKAQADLIASTLNVSISGVLSVSSSVGDYGPIYAIPMMGGSTRPGAPLPAPTEGIALPQLSVSLTIAYSIG